MARVDTRALEALCFDIANDSISYGKRLEERRREREKSWVPVATTIDFSSDLRQESSYSNRIFSTLKDKLTKFPEMKLANTFRGLRCHIWSSIRNVFTSILV
jgi:hypothetical protein